MKNMVNILATLTSQAINTQISNKVIFAYSCVLLKFVNNQHIAFQVLDVFV